MSANASLDTWTSPSAMEEWWKSPSQRHIARNYEAKAVVSLRDLLPEAPNVLPLKLRSILGKHQAERTMNIASSVIDTVSMQMMAEVGLGRSFKVEVILSRSETAYVSGGMTSMTETATYDPSTDLVSQLLLETLP